MKLDKESLLLYGVTDRAWLQGDTLAERVEKALQGGTTFLQLREKELGYGDFLAEALEIKRICAKYNVPFVINDNVEVALAAGADGAHVGQSDMELTQARKRLGDDSIIGVSVQTVQQALRAEEQGADYLGVGAVFHTGTKADADDVSIDTLRAICDAVNIPVVAIGGITRDNIKLLGGTGIDGVAVVSAIFAHKDADRAAGELVSELKRVFS